MPKTFITELAITELAEQPDATKIRAILHTPSGAIHLQSFIRELAFYGHGDLLLELVKNTKYYPSALETAAKAGHTEIVENLLAQDKDNKEKLLAYVLQGASVGRHFAQVAKLISEGQNPMICLNALSCDGILKQVDYSLLLNALHDEAIKTKVEQLVSCQFELESSHVLR